MDGMVVERKDAVFMKLAARLALEYLKDVPVEKQDSFLLGPAQEKVTYPDAVGAIECLVDAI